MFALCAIENLRQLKDYGDAIMEEAIAIGHELDVARRMHNEASAAYFALTPSSDNLDAALISTDYNTAVKNLVSISQRVNAKVDELNTVKQQIKEAKRQMKDAAEDDL